MLIALIGASLSVAIARTLGVGLDAWGVVACAAGVHAAYQFDALVDDVGFPRPGAGFEPAAFWRDRRLAWLAIDGAILTLSLAMSWRLLAPLAVLSSMGLLYVPLKRYVPKNLLTAVAWTLAIFGLSLHGIALDAEALRAAAILFLTVASNANLCDLADVEDDRAKGVQGFAPWWGTKAAARIGGAAALVAVALAARAGAPALAFVPALYAAIGLAAPSLVSSTRARHALDGLLVLPGPLSMIF